MKKARNAKTTDRTQEQKVSGRMIKNLAAKLYRADRRRNMTAIVAIALSAMMVVMVFSTLMSVTRLMRQNQQMMFGTQAEGVYMTSTVHWSDLLQDSGYFDEVSYAVYMGFYETDMKEKTGNLLLYTDEKTAGWNFNELIEGRWAQKDGEIVVDEHFIENHGGNVHVGDVIPIRLTTAAQEVERDMVVSGICTANDALEEARVYVSEAFFMSDLSGSRLQTYCRFEDGRYTREDLETILQGLISREFAMHGLTSEKCEAAPVLNPAAGSNLNAGSLALLGGLIFITVVCAGLMVYTIYYISSVKNVVQYGQLKLLGVTEKQIKRIVRSHALRQYWMGLPTGCFAGVLFSYVLMPVMASYAGLEGRQPLMLKLEYFLYAAILSWIVVSIGTKKPMRILAQTPPIHTIGFTGSSKGKTGKVCSVRFTPGRFACKNIRKRRKKTALVVTSVSIVMLLFVVTMNIIHSLDVDSLVAVFNQFADVEIATEHMLTALEAGVSVNVEEIPGELRVALEKVSEGMETIYHYNLYAQSFLYGEDAEKYCEILLDDANYQEGLEQDSAVCENLMPRAKAYREKGTPILTQQSYRFYDYGQVSDFEVFEGEIDKEKYESGEYVLAVAMDGYGNTCFHAGDTISLYDEFPDRMDYTQDGNGRYPFFDSLHTREYTVLAVVSDTYRNQMAGGDKHTGGFAYIMPTQLMETFSKEPALFMVTMNAPDAKTLAKVEPQVRACLEKMGGKDVVSCRSKGTYKEALEQMGRSIGLIGNGLAILVGMMALVNFLNSTVSGIAERREEFSTLQAIGMMKRLLIKVLRLENLYTVLWAVIPGFLIGHLVSAAAIHKISETLPYFKWNGTILPGILLAVGIILAAMIYPNGRTDISNRRL
ncbi:MAG: ABC transporter permease [Blautia sp.]|nr:ABC transporter permease [Lachnoclostridium sp.]MCM1211677.1 ABC transporter permease [Blautia sp.]